MVCGPETEVCGDGRGVEEEKGSEDRKQGEEKRKRERKRGSERRNGDDRGGGGGEAIDGGGEEPERRSTEAGQGIPEDEKGDERVERVGGR